jgi:sigma-54 specific flagellar transcriptional regulator A
MLQHYGWPGNVRELANLLERLAILYPNAVIEVKNLPEKFQSGDLIDLNPSGEEETLVATVQPNISLNVRRTTLVEKMRKYEIV